jgi:hypothetical protein
MGRLVKGLVTRSRYREQRNSRLGGTLCNKWRDVWKKDMPKGEKKINTEVKRI